MIQANDEDPDVGFCLTLFGPAGGGKTHLAASVAKFVAPRRVLLCDAEGGSRVLRGLYDNLDIAKITAWSQFDNLTQIAVKNPTGIILDREVGGLTTTEPGEGYRAFIFDNLSEYQNLSVESIAGAGEMATQPEWGKSTADILNKLRTWRDLTRTNNIIVIFIAWDEPVQDRAGGTTKTRVAFTPSLQRQFPGIVDSIGHVSAPDRQPDVRVLDFTPGPRTDAKFRRAPGSNAMKIPYRMQYGVDDTPLPSLLEVMEGGEWPANKYNIRQAQ